ncbi:ABC transporter substrate-binding protein [Desulfobacterota bacterium AH_259_B03_O07]|nr:ABC transporter substrate-binding protein [Desulfobacterota bacterium AH_259_B03_O07]
MKRHSVRLNFLSLRRRAMQRPFILFLLSLMLTFGMVILGYGQTDSGNEPAPLVLGVIYNLSGSQAGLDVPSSRGARLAVEEVNRDGGQLGRPVLLVLEDGESKPSVVKRKTADLLNRFPSTTALMGLSDTDMVLAAAPVAARNQRLFLTSGATSPRLPAQVPEYLFLACFGDNVQAAAGAEWAYQDLGARTVSILFNSTKSYTRLLEGYFQIRFKQLGGKVLSVQGYKPDDMSQAIRGLKKSDLIFLSAEEPVEALKAVRLLRKAGFSGPILGGDGFDSEYVWREHPDVSNVFFTTHAYLGADNPAPKVVAFRKAYVRAYPGSSPDAFAALGYDATRLLMAAISTAEGPGPGNVLKALARIREFEGVTGTMSYPPGSRIPTKSVTILEIERGKRKLVRELLPARVPPP